MEGQSYNPCGEIFLGKMEKGNLGSNLKLQATSETPKKFPYHPKGCFYAGREAMKEEKGDVNPLYINGVVVPNPCGEVSLAEINETMPKKDLGNLTKGVGGSD